jgi:hypothetical protein
MKPRVCPYCLHIETDDSHILASFNGKRRDGTMVAGCMCPECNGIWDEFAHKNGITMLRLRNGRMVDEGQIRAEAAEKGATE